MSATPDTHNARPLSEITFTLHAGTVMSAGELEVFRRSAEKEGETPEQRMIRLIREDNARKEQAA